jgi:hypothetical protein
MSGKNNNQEELGKASPSERVALSEYTSILRACGETVLRPIVNKKMDVDRTALSLVREDLELKVNSPNFKMLPLKITEAYIALKGFVETLEATGDVEIALTRDVLEGLLYLGVNCDVYGLLCSGESFSQGRNPCRFDQYQTRIAIKKARETEGNTPLIESFERMIGNCLMCPYV